jgi:hypothetical protein
LLVGLYNPTVANRGYGKRAAKASCSALLC